MKISCRSCVPCAEGRRLAIGVLVGLNVASFVSASIIFSLVGSAVPSSESAGAIAGEIFRATNLSTAILLGMLLAGEGADVVHRTGPRWLGAGLLAAALLLTLVEMGFVTPRIHDLRETLRAEFGAVSSAPKTDSRRTEFGALHGVSVLRGGAVVLLLLGAWGASARVSRRGVPAPDVETSAR